MYVFYVYFIASFQYGESPRGGAVYSGDIFSMNI